MSDARSFDVIRALIDVSTWTAFRARGFTSTEAEEAVSELILRSLPRSAD